MNRDAFGGQEVEVQYCDADVLNAFDKDGNAKNMADATELTF